MNGFLSGLLTAVAIVATVVSGGTLGIVAGALMAMSYAASKGWIGGSVGKFFNSSTGHYLTMAVGLASAAGAMMANSSAVAATSQSSTVSAANTAAEGGAATTTATEGATAADTANMGVNAAGVPNSLAAESAAAPTVTGTAAQTMAPGTFTQTANAMNAGSNTTLGGLSNSSMAASDVEAQQVSQLTGIPAAPSVSGSVTTGTTDAATQEATAGQTAGQGISDTQKAVNSTTDTINKPITVSGNPNQVMTPTQQAQASPDFGGGASPGPSVGSKAMGMLGKASDVLEKHAGLATVAGNALSGMAQGAAQQKMMQEQIAAQQWGNMQWQDPTQVAKLQSAAAQPIGVPVGYLNRAAAVRNLMNTSGGGQTTPLSGQTPVAPTVKPVGMGG